MKNLMLVLLILASPSGIGGFLFRSGDNVTIHETVNGDMYIAAGTVIINAPIRGDLVVTGGTITVNDSIAQDLIVAGGTVIINGYIGDDIRAAGGSLQLSGNVFDDVIIAGGEFSMHEGATVNGNLVAFNGKIKINGQVNGEARIQAGRFDLNGIINHNLTCRAEEIYINGKVLGTTSMAARKIEVGAQASFEDEVRYWSKKETDWKNSLVSGTPVYDSSLQIETGNWVLLGFTSLLLLLWYLGMALLIIFFIQYLFGKTLQEAAVKALNESLKSIGLGVLLFIGIPLGIVISFITIVGVPLGVVLLFAFIIIIMLATAVTSLVAVNWINNVYYQSSWKTGRLVIFAFFMFIILKLASLTPVVGPLIMFVLVCMAYGSIMLTIKWKREYKTS